MYRKLSLRARIFIAMIALVAVAFLLIAGVTIYQYREQSEDYHQQRLERKEAQLKTSLTYVIQNKSFEVSAQDLDTLFGEELYEISDVQNVDFRIYDLQGKLISNSNPTAKFDAHHSALTPEILSVLQSKPMQHYIETESRETGIYRVAYFYILNPQDQPIGIVSLLYYDDDSLSSMELKEFMIRLAQVYLLMLIIAIILAFLVSAFITHSLEVIGIKMAETKLNKENKKIDIKGSGREIQNLISAYNKMVDKLEDSAAKLAKSEREQAWREMAKQVAHEIKNPLTPMRLTVQSFQKRFNPKTPMAQEDLDDFSNTLIQQIDTMSSIATAFSNFAEMPAQQREEINVVKITRLALDIFKEKGISFHASEEEIWANLDRTQLIRVITNLVKNALQACEDIANPKIEVRVASNKNQVVIEVHDNGIGIEKANLDKIFEPKFTTKSSGMGLGLGMVKNIVDTYKGSISVKSSPGKSTFFRIVFPQSNTPSRS